MKMKRMIVGGTVSSMNGDMAIIREWAEAKVSRRRFATDYDLEVARHILATTTAPTMADIAWDDAVHVGLCALYANGDLVRMIGPDPAPYKGGAIICHWVYCASPVTGRLPAEHRTPLPGTRLDLTPRREPEPEPTPGHPAVLTIEADYRNAPAGTVVATEGEEAWTKGRDGLWETFGIISGYNNYAMADGPRQVLRWGWEA